MNEERGVRGKEMAPILTWLTLVFSSSSSHCLYFLLVPSKQFRYLVAKDVIAELSCSNTNDVAQLHEDTADQMASSYILI